jgi:hypothetical protein
VPRRQRLYETHTVENGIGDFSSIGGRHDIIVARNTRLIDKRSAL